MVFSNVFITEPIIKLEKLLVHGSLVGPAVEPVMSYIYILYNIKF